MRLFGNISTMAGNLKVVELSLCFISYSKYIML